MKLETYLSAYAQVYARSEHDPFWGVFADDERRMRQARAFRDWIIRHDERQKMRIAELEELLESESNWADEYFQNWQKAIGSEYGEVKR